MLVRRASGALYKPLSRPQTTSSAEKSLPAHRNSFIKRIGPYSLGILVVAFILMAIALAFLCHLWVGDRNSISWRWVILNDYVGSAVALAALAIQVSVSSSGAVAVSMLSSLAMERWGVPLSQSLAISTMRYNNSGPLLSLWSFVRQARKTHGWKAVTFCLLMAVITLAANFSSTILLFDVHPGQIHGVPEMVDVPLGWTEGTSKEPATWYQNFMLQTPSAYQTFAEWSDPPEPAENMSDTGPLVRALLPFASEQTRTSIQNYEGPAKVFDARVACVRPNFVDSTFVVNSDLVNFTGQVGISARPPGLDSQRGNGDGASLNGFPLIPFECSVGYGTQICPLERGSVDLGLRSWLWEYFNSTQNVTASAFLFFESQYMLDAYNDTSNGTYRPLFNYNTTNQGQGWNSTGDGPWLNLQPTNWTLKPPCEATNSCSPSCEVFKTCGRPGLNASLCFDALWPDMDLPVQFNATQSRTEPKVTIDPTTNQLDLTPVRHQLGATGPRLRLSPTARNILTLSISSVRAALDALRPADLSPSLSAKLLDGSSLWFTLNPDYNGGGATSWTFCRDLRRAQCAYGGVYDANTSTTLASVTQGLLARSILDDDAGHDPAAALSAALTVLARMQFYDAAATFDFPRSAAATAFVTKAFPHAARGLAVVAGVCVAHVALVGALALAFARGTAWSLLDAAWAAAAQMQTEGVGEILRTATAMRDGDVEGMVVGEAGGGREGGGGGCAGEA
ncbi:uncharacterized protein BKCO1_5000026 [Diplodia corticola]|uniref:Uncharacterized protein n=1 Tax=Diplodia corticola TaxID=236234 RepID=A0A1J9RTQ0_9PEZI|nr:uncharacterized protein BKCO1_5000026 [Diplodia corticola]OJD31244.1 hypothetical protein BKCO1_5000026 [Diplodia corticola]